MTLTQQPLDRSDSTVADMLDALRSRMRIAVVYGGDSNADDAVIYRTFNPRPWRSYESVARDIHGALAHSS